MVIYGMFISALLFYNKFKSNLEEYSFKFNAYNACIANRKVNGKQHNIKFLV